eukprot:gene11013-14791_t
MSSSFVPSKFTTTENAGWDDIQADHFGLDISRTKLIERVLSREENSFAEIQVNSTNDYDNILSSLEIDGVVKIEGLFSLNLVDTMKLASEKALNFCKSIQWKLDKRESQELNGDEESLGITFVTKHEPRRLDIFPAITEYLLPEITDDALCPPLLKQLLTDSFKSCGWAMNSNGFIPCLPGAKEGDWHRDIRPMFVWPQAHGSATISDMLDCTMLPDFYFTAIIYLNDVQENCGLTEFILGSHKLSVEDSQHQGRYACNSNSKAGDVMLFNGKILHRGRGNKSEVERHALYTVFAAKWYADS